MKFATFMASGAGRTLRAVVGVLLVWWGFMMAGVVSYAVIAFGIIAIASGLFNFCLIAPFLGVPFMGKDLKGTPTETPT